MLRTVLFLACLVPAAGLRAQDPHTDALEHARGMIAAQHYQEAIPVLEQLVKDWHEDGLAWLALGDAHRGLGQLQAAADAYLHAEPIAAVHQTAVTSLFILYAGAGRADDAYKWFSLLQQSHAGDLSALAEHPEVGKLHGDRRFAVLFPDRLKFEPPFSSGTRIIHEWRGERAGDEFGWIARGLGDVDGDGISDVVISATGNPPYGDGRGKLYVYSGKSGRLLWKVQGGKGALLGLGLESAGDVDGDGAEDVVAGAPGEDAVYVYSGRDGRLLRRIAGTPQDHDLGTAVSGVGDIDHDGVPDLLAGAPSGEVYARDSATGRAYLFSGKTGKPLLALHGEHAGEAFGSTVGGGQGRFIVGAAAAGRGQHGRVYVYDRLAAQPAFVEEADATGAALGYMFVSVLGDVDGDGTPDVYASDFSNAAKGRATGRAYVYSGKDGRLLRTFTGEQAGAGFGIGAARAGDVDKDGHADLVVGSWQYSGGAWSGGRVQVFSGKDGRRIQDIVGTVPGETLGFDAVGIGDVDGDGLTDYLVTSAWSGINGLRSGRAYIVAGSAPAP